ncbi:MAG: helix-turn-helix transcriptional regulator [Deltaproteobacteria bacterium]|nr:helix-turn-helix transcriptional regulator [Deltaproteobacteria bacterium]
MRERIDSGAREVFAKQGFQATTVDELAELADVAPATSFNHRQDERALLGLMTGEIFETLHSLTTRHLEAAGSGSEKLRGVIGAAAEGISANRGVARNEENLNESPNRAYAAQE